MAMEMNVSNLKVTNREEILRTPRLSVKRTSFTDGVMVGAHTTIHSNASVAVIVKKDAKTIICDETAPYIINLCGNSGMATAGSGDVLSGILLSLCATGKDILKSVAVGSYINGYAGEIASGELCDIAMSAGDTARSVGLAISKLLKS